MTGLRPRLHPHGPLCCGLLALACSHSLLGQSTDSTVEVSLLPAAPTGGALQSAAAAVATATVSGDVVNSTGALMAGAGVTLTVSGAPPRTATTDSEGHFVLQGITAGDYTVVITLPGFTPITQTGTLQPGQKLTLGPITVAMSTVNVSVDAIMPEQLALEQVHTEEHQRLAGILPNFFVSYDWNAQPLTWRQKYALATHNVLDPGNLALAATVAGVQQAANAFPGYHQGAAGYGKRFGADLANLVAGSYMGGAVLPSLFHQDPRYFYKGTGTIRSRALYAVSRAVVTRGDNGHSQVNYSGVLGDLSAAALSNLYYPASDRQGATLFFENGILAVGGDALTGLVQEFLFNRITTRGAKVKKQQQP